MQATRSDIEFLIGHLKDLEFSLKTCCENVFMPEYKCEKSPEISGVVARDIAKKLAHLITECDTRPLNKRAAAAANALADGAYLLKGSIEEGTSMIVAADTRLNEEENFLAQFYTTPPKLNEERIILENQKFIDARDYARKALELVKPLARTQGFDIEALELQGELFL